ncbi:monooxygenase [Thalassiella azotivora]
MTTSHPGNGPAGVLGAASRRAPGAPAPGEPPALVTVHLWGVPPAGVPAALGRMALDQLLVRRLPATFTKLLGTGRGRTFTLGDADPGHWALLACWQDAADAEALERSPTARAWRRIADEELRVHLRPLASRGRWSRREPFGRPQPRRTTGPVASVTRARIRPRELLTFHRAVPPVAADLRQVPGLRLALGVGEAPVGLQGTFSLWRDGEALREFAHRRNPHATAVRQTTERDWYAEELFARFEVLSIEGTYAGRQP